MQDFDFSVFISMLLSSSLGGALITLAWNFYVHRNKEEDKKRKACHIY